MEWSTKLEEELLFSYQSVVNPSLKHLCWHVYLCDVSHAMCHGDLDHPAPGGDDVPDALDVFCSDFCFWMMNDDEICESPSQTCPCGDVCDDVCCHACDDL